MRYLCLLAVAQIIPLLEGALFNENAYSAEMFNSAVDKFTHLSFNLPTNEARLHALEWKRKRAAGFSNLNRSCRCWCTTSESMVTPRSKREKSDRE